MTSWTIFEVYCSFRAKNLQADIANSKLFCEEMRRSAHFTLKIETHLFILLQLKKLSCLFAHGENGQKLSYHIFLFYFLCDATCCIRDLIENNIVSNNVDHDLFSLILQCNIPVHLLTTENAYSEFIILFPLFEYHSKRICQGCPSFSFLQVIDQSFVQIVPCDLLAHGCIKRKWCSQGKRGDDYLQRRHQINIQVRSCNDQNHLLFYHSHLLFIRFTHFNQKSFKQMFHFITEDQQSSSFSSIQQQTSLHSNQKKEKIVNFPLVFPLSIQQRNLDLQLHRLIQHLQYGYSKNQQLSFNFGVNRMSKYYTPIFLHLLIVKSHSIRVHFEVDASQTAQKNLKIAIKNLNLTTHLLWILNLYKDWCYFFQIAFIVVLIIFVLFYFEGFLQPHEKTQKYVSKILNAYIQHRLRLYRTYFLNDIQVHLFL